jgi:hypothetical protein
MLVFNKNFYENKKLKLCIGDYVAVLNDMFYESGGSTLHTGTAHTLHQEKKRLK